MASRKLCEVAKTIRSKNAGVDKVTFDVIFPDPATYNRVRESGVLARRRSAGSSASMRHKSPITSSSTRHWRSSSRSTAECRAAAPATPTSSAASNTARCSTLKCRTVEERP